MTLTSLLPTLRHSMPDPWRSAHRPSCTECSLDGVVLGGTSMTAAALTSGTPLLVAPLLAR